MTTTPRSPDQEGNPMTQASGQVATVDLHDLLGQAVYERMREQIGARLPLLPGWDALPGPVREVYRERLAYLIPVLQPLLDAAAVERRRRNRFAVGGPDTTDGRLGHFCLAGLGPLECTRAPHVDDVHAVGDGTVLTAAWVATP